jgi:hypothetical protein
MLANTLVSQKPPIKNTGAESLVEMVVTPEIAESWLAKRAPFQRDISDDVVAKYAADMRKGVWRYVPSLVVSLTPDGFILDGQHRLSAVVRTGIPQRFMVHFDGDRSHFAVIDRGRVRNPVQLAAMAGCKYCASNHVSAANSLLWNPASPITIIRGGNWSGEEMGDVLHYFEPELAMVFPAGLPGGSHFRHGALRGALLRSAIAYPNDHRKIHDFLGILTSGNSNPDYSHDLNNMVLSFHTKYLTLKGLQSGGTHKTYEIRRWVWSQALDSVQRFIRNKPRKALMRMDRLPTEHQTPIWLDNKPPQMLFKPFVQSFFRSTPNPVFNGVPIRPLPTQIQ